MSQQTVAKHASHVVVDTHDGYTFWRGEDGVLFTESMAKSFAEKRNAALKVPTYRLFVLVEQEA